MVDSCAMHCETVQSTNETARHWIDKFPDNIKAAHIVSANKQTRGKGRNGKSWWSPEDRGLYASFVRRYNHVEVEMLTTWLGHGVVSALRKYTLLDIKQEGINDIYLDKRKLGGILCEVYKDYLIVGIGINLFRPVNIRKDLVGKSIWLSEYASEYLCDKYELINLLSEVIFK